jgi:hypothetical protein
MRLARTSLERAAHLYMRKPLKKTDFYSEAALSTSPGSDPKWSGGSIEISIHSDSVTGETKPKHFFLGLNTPKQS